MTTVACDGKSMASDSQCGGDTFHCEVEKMVRANDGAILGCCGIAIDIYIFLDWYNVGDRTVPLTVSEDFDGLVLKPDGVIHCVHRTGRSFIHAAPAVVGSGCRFAYGAMDAGKSPVEAVRIAAARDGSTGGSIKVMHLKEELKEIAA